MTVPGEDEATTEKAELEEALRDAIDLGGNDLTNHDVLEVLERLTAEYRALVADNEA